MKKYVSILLVTLLCTGIITGCKKDSSKDYSAPLKDKAWWGMFAYTGKTPQYYSVMFMANNTLIWSQLSGDYPGNWALDGKALTMTFAGNSLQIKAELSDDNKLTYIADNTADSDISSCQIIEHSDFVLENTQWEGAYTLRTNAPLPMRVDFKTGNKVIVYIAGYQFAASPYTRSPSGAAIRGNLEGTTPFFVVVTSNTEIKGSVTSSDYVFQLAKQ